MCSQTSFYSKIVTFCFVVTAHTMRRKTFTSKEETWLLLRFNSARLY